MHSHLGQESGERARESWGLWVRTVSGYPRFWAETQATARPVSRAKPSTWKGALTPASTPVQTWRWGPAGPVTCPPALEEARSKPGPAARPSLSGPFLPWALNGLRGECSRRTRAPQGKQSHWAGSLLGGSGSGGEERSELPAPRGRPQHHVPDLAPSPRPAASAGQGKHLPH